MRKTILLLLTLLLLTANATLAREIVDMAGRTVTVPDRITKVYAAQPYTHVLLTVLAPDLSAGLPGPLTEVEKKYLRPEIASLPVLGTGIGPGKQANLETVLAQHPDLVLVKGGTKEDPSALVEKFAKIGLPVVCVDLDRIEAYPAGLEFVGKLLGREKRAEELAAYARRTLAAVAKGVAKVPPEKRVRVYYAESPDGLATECDQSFHADAIRLAGGDLVHHCTISRHIGIEQVSLEQILGYDPEVIIATEADFAQAVRTDARWQKVRAVTSGRIYTVPRSPFNWIDRPPSVMRLLGIQWLANRFYPKEFTIDLKATTREFLQLFLGVRPSDDDLEQLLR